ncbi:MAG: hypothetical protein ACF8LL_12590, partial [Phycisphaerales bacterium]
MRCAHEKPGLGARVVCWFSLAGSVDTFDGSALIDDTDRAGVKERYAVTPEQFVDFLALTGDKSD